MIGDVVYARFPLADRPVFKERPCLVISAADEFADLRVLKISSKRLVGPGRIKLEPDDFLRGGLPLPSCVVLDDAATTNVAVLTGYAGSLSDPVVRSILKARIGTATRTLARLAHAANRPGDDPLRPPFAPGDTVPYAGRVFAEDEVEAAVASTLDFWLTLGPEGAVFEAELAALLGVKHSLLVNSGSSANLVALAALTSHKLPAAKRLRPGDEVITVAAGFPTTVAPILQVGAVPVFIDNDPVTGNARADRLAAAYAPGKTKAVLLAHTLGNPFDLGAVLAFCRRHDLWLIEDNCDSLGSTYAMPVAMAEELGLAHLLKIAAAGTHPLIRFRESAGGGRHLVAPTGAWGDLSTQSFYPPHHLTMGEGGAVNIVSRPPLKTCAESIRDWGRDCWCASGKDNTCGKRFGWQLGELPAGYDHKYIYSHIGYNLKPLEPTNAYAASKAAASVAAAGFVAGTAARLAVLRPFHVFGEGEPAPRLWPSLRRAAANGEDFPMTAGEQVRDFVPAEDVAAAFLAALARTDIAPGKAVFENVGSGVPQSLRSFAEFWWRQWGARGRLLVGALPYRANEVMRYVPELGRAGPETALHETG